MARWIVGAVISQWPYYVLSGAPAGTHYAPLAAYSEIASNQDGFCVEQPDHRFDYDGDGLFDLMIGCEADDTNGPGALPVSGAAGAAWLHLSPVASGIVDMRNADVSLLGDINHAAGSAVDAADLNGDGYGDALIGAHEIPWGVGRAYAAFGPTLGTRVLSTSADITWLGEDIWSGAGNAVATADFDMDGFQDVAIAADHYGAADEGRVFVAYGPFATGAHNLADVFTRIDGHPEDWLGFNNLASGDVDGDGYPDLLAGSTADDKGPFMGAAYVFLGGVL